MLNYPVYELSPSSTLPYARLIHPVYILMSSASCAPPQLVELRPRRFDLLSVEVSPSSQVVGAVDVLAILLMVSKVDDGDNEARLDDPVHELGILRREPLPKLRSVRAVTIVAYNDRDYVWADAVALLRIRGAVTIERLVGMP